MADYDWNAFSSMLGQLAGAVAPGTWQGNVGAVAAQLGQGQKVAEAQEAQRAREAAAYNAIYGQQTNQAQNRAMTREELMQLVNNLTGEGAQTTGLTIGDDGTIKFSGKLAEPQAQEEQINATLDKLSAPAQGGGNRATSPFYNMLGTLDKQAWLG